MTYEQACREAESRTGMPARIGDWFTEVWVNKRYLVMVAPREGGVLQLLVQRTDGTAKRSWQDLQAIKNDIAGHEAVAIELFPAEAEVKDGAHVSHLWVLPQGFALPVRSEWV